MSSGDIDMLTGLPRQLSNGQLAKGKKPTETTQQTKTDKTDKTDGKKPAETTQHTKTDKTDDKKPAQEKVSIVLTIEEEDNGEDDDEIDEDEAKRLSKILEAFERKKEKKIQLEKLKEATKLQEDLKKAADKIAELQKKREDATEKISLIRDEIDLIDGEIASLYTQFPDLDPTQANNDSEDDDVSVGGADIRPTPTAETAKKDHHRDEKWQVASSFAGKTAMTIPQKETGKQVASSGAVKILEILETETEQQKVGRFYLNVFPNGKKPCINAYVYWFLELLLAFKYIPFNPAKGCQKTIEECGLCKNHNLKGFFKKVEIESDKFFKCLDLFDALLNSSFRFYGVNITIDQYKVYQGLVDSFHE